MRPAALIVLSWAAPALAGCVREGGPGETSDPSAARPVDEQGAAVRRDAYESLIVMVEGRVDDSSDVDVDQQDLEGFRTLLSERLTNVAGAGGFSVRSRVSAADRASLVSPRGDVDVVVRFGLYQHRVGASEQSQIGLTGRVVDGYTGEVVEQSLQSICCYEAEAFPENAHSAAESIVDGALFALGRLCASRSFWVGHGFEGPCHAGFAPQGRSHPDSLDRMIDGVTTD